MKFKCVVCTFESEEEIISCPQCADRNNKQNVLSGLGNFFSNTGEMISKKTGELFDEDTFLVRHSKTVADKFSSTYEETGVKRLINTASGFTEEKFDVVSGQAMYELVQERLVLQDRYNDILATKLHEALEKIKELEEKISRLEKK